MQRWLQHIADDLHQRDAAHLRRRLHAVDRCARVVQRGDRTLLNLAGNDYLGLASHPHLRDAVIDAAERFGVGSGASRLLSGDLDIHREVEARFARFKSAPAALLTPTGYAANLAVIQTLAGPDDVVMLDKLNHASIIDAARASGATVRVFPHLGYDKLSRLLERASGARRRIIVTDSVFSMDGDVADLPALCELRDAHDAILVIDEAHATGLLGPTGAGLAELQGVAGAIDVTVSTAGKALGSVGGIITGHDLVIDALVNGARNFIYSTAPPPTQAAAIGAALDLVESEPSRRTRLAELSRTLRRTLHAQGWPVPLDDPTPIVPVIVGDNAVAERLSEQLDAAGFLVPAIRPPTVASGSARLRISLRADLTDDDITGLATALGSPAARIV